MATLSNASSGENGGTPPPDSPQLAERALDGEEQLKS